MPDPMLAIVALVVTVIVTAGYRLIRAFVNAAMFLILFAMFLYLVIAVASR